MFNVYWKNYLKEKPKITGKYLCTVLVPLSGGSYDKRLQSLYYEKYSASNSGRWICDDMIVTHWLNFDVYKLLPTFDF